MFFSIGIVCQFVGNSTRDSSPSGNGKEESFDNATLTTTQKRRKKIIFCIIYRKVKVNGFGCNK
jgi:hypothetical protein